MTIPSIKIAGKYELLLPPCSSSNLLRFSKLLQHIIQSERSHIILLECKGGFLFASAPPSEKSCIHVIALKALNPVNIMVALVFYQKIHNDKVTNSQIWDVWFTTLILGALILRSVSKWMEKSLSSELVLWCWLLQAYDLMDFCPQHQWLLSHLFLGCWAPVGSSFVGLWHDNFYAMYSILLWVV